MTLEFRDEAPVNRPVVPSQVFHVPHDRNPWFTGRDVLLGELHAQLDNPDPSGHVHALYGLAGVGKTQLAVEYAHRYRDRYAVVYWFPAEEAAAAWVRYAELARALGLPLPPDASLEQARNLLRRHLEGRGDYLLVFDNAPGASAVRDFIPRPCRGAVLITSRSPNWGAVARSGAVHGLSREQSITFLRKRTKRIDSDHAANKLAQALGDLPLALEQAAALIERSRISFADYLGLFESYWTELLQQQRPGGDYPDSVAMTWELSLRQVEAQNPGAAPVLNLLAFLSPDGVPRRLIEDYVGELPDALQPTAADPLALDRALNALADYSLVEVHEDPDAPMYSIRARTVLSMHRLVAAIARDRLDEDQRREWAGAAARLMARAFRFDSADAATWPAAFTALPHALAAATHAQATGVPVELTCGLLDHAGRFLNRFGRYEEAKGLLDRALALSRRAYGDESPRVSQVANNLGRVLARLGQADLARQHFEWALAIDRNTYGDADPHVASVLNNYAMVLHASGQLESAREHFQSALAIFEGHYGPAHPKVATLLNNLGYIHLSGGDHATAHDLFQRALTTAEATLGGGHPLVASVLYNLAKALCGMGGAPAARDPLERALAIDAAAYGENHPDTLRDLAALASLLRQTGDDAAAAAYEARATAVTQALAESKATAEPMAAIEA